MSSSSSSHIGPKSIFSIESGIRMEKWVTYEMVIFLHIIEPFSLKTKIINS